MNPATSRIFASILESRTGQQLASSRHWRIGTALKPLLRERDIESLDRLAASIRSAGDGALTDKVVEALLNNETFFYREPAAFDLVGRAMLQLQAARASTRRLRIWCAGCSTGQEAYSLAMTFADDVRWEGWTIDILATDVSRAAIAQAREGLYSQFEIQRGLPIRTMMRWFDADGESWRALPELRRRVMFQTHNLLDAPPSPARCDVILCRNVLLYFAVPVREAVFERLASVIAPDGVLMLGAGETVIGQSGRFISHAEHRGLYRRA